MLERLFSSSKNEAKPQKSVRNVIAAFGGAYLILIATSGCVYHTTTEGGYSPYAYEYTQPGPIYEESFGVVNIGPGTTILEQRDERGKTDVYVGVSPFGKLYNYHGYGQEYSGYKKEVIIIEPYPPRSYDDDNEDHYRRHGCNYCD